MTHRDRRHATEDAACDLAACMGRFCNRARDEDAAGTAGREPVEVDPLVAARVAAIMAQLRMWP